MRDPGTVGAAATRRWRERREQGLVVVPVELWRREIVTLVRLGLLRREDVRDHEAIEDVVGKVPDRALGRAMTCGR